MNLEPALHEFVDSDDPRVKLSASCVLTLLVANILVAREPVCGVGEWASNYAPDLFNLWADELTHLNDDRVGRSLDRLFDALDSDLVMSVVRHVVEEFNISLDELHNDSTTVSFYGAYDGQDEVSSLRGHRLPGITHGHSKDHRPDLKQLLYILTVSNDGGVPIYFQTESGNTTDDKTHQATWQILKDLVGRPDFGKRPPGRWAECRSYGAATGSYEGIAKAQGLLARRRDSCRSTWRSSRCWRSSIRYCRTASGWASRQFQGRSVA